MRPNSHVVFIQHGNWYNACK